MQNVIRVAVAGCGAITERNHLPALAALGSDVEVVGLADPIASRRGVCLPLAPRAAEFDQLTDALEATQPDLVVVASPSALHRDQSIDALRHGAHVLCEKPLALRASDCTEMIEVATRAVRLLGVGLVRRGFPSVQSIRSLLENEVLGKPQTFEVLEGFVYAWPVQSAHPFLRDGGGVLLDAGPHAIDLLQLWFGKLEVADYADDAVGGVEANCRLDLRAAGDVTGRLRMSRELNMPNRHVIHCERGWVAYHYDVADRFYWGWHGSSSAHVVVVARPPGDQPMWGESDLLDKVAGHLGAAFLNLHRNMIAAIRGAEPVLVPATEAAAGIAIIEECLDRRRTMEMSWLDEDEWERASAIESAMVSS